MKGYLVDIETLTEQNIAVRSVLYTEHNLQLVLMALSPGQDNGKETHRTHGQFFRIESGLGEVEIDGTRPKVKEDVGLIVPAGAKHNLITTGDKSLHLCTICSPPNHIDKLVKDTRAEAEPRTNRSTGLPANRALLQLSLPSMDDPLRLVALAAWPGCFLQSGQSDHRAARPVGQSFGKPWRLCEGDPV